MLVSIRTCALLGTASSKEERNPPLPVKLLSMSLSSMRINVYLVKSPWQLSQLANPTFSNISNQRANIYLYIHTCIHVYINLNRAGLTVDSTSSSSSFRRLYAQCLISAAKR